MTFKTYDASRDQSIAYLLAVLGALVVIAGYFLAWVGVPSTVSAVKNRGTCAFDILLASNGSLNAIGNGGVGEGSVSCPVRTVCSPGCGGGRGYFGPG